MSKKNRPVTGLLNDKGVIVPDKHPTAKFQIGEPVCVEWIALNLPQKQCGFITGYEGGDPGIGYRVRLEGFQLLTMGFRENDIYSLK